ncbi:MAG: error-prone DNA polymerase [Spirochaetales bacterium]|nr:error-prone DNA polymerase [Spirochaetales bacterium]
MPVAPGYVPLWCKSNYSFLEGASHPEELVRQASALGLPALALTDRDGLYGIVRAHVEARKLGVKLLVGAQLSLEDGGRILLLARDREGYANLCALISAGRLRSPKGSSRVRLEEVLERAAGLVALGGLESSLAPLAASDAARAGAAGGRSTLAALREAFGDRLYALVARHRGSDEPDREARLRRQAADLGIPVAAGTEVLYHDPARRRLQDVLTCIRHNCTLDRAGTRLRLNDQHGLRSPEEFLDLYREDPEAIERTLEIAGRCSFSLEEIRYRYPSEALPDGLSSAQWLRRLTLAGAERRYGRQIPPAVRQQLDKELGLIEELDYCGYFLTMREIVEFCQRRGILCQGRGSAANSVVCYCLEITAVDPVRMQLLFERFISRERDEPPDIDLDIEHRRREEVIQHVYERYGRDRAAMVANMVRYRLRSAVRDVGRVLGLPATTLNRLARLLPAYGGDLEESLRQAGMDLDNPQIKRLAELGGQILEFPRHLSIHPGGFLLGAEPVSRFVPVENATMPGRTVIQWDKYDVEDMHLFKVDLLGLGALTHLDYAFRLLKKHRNLDLDMASVPPDDPAVYDLASRADTVGVFQIESRAQMAMLPRLKPRSFYDLVIEISIVRPGPIVGGMVHPYLRRRSGAEPVEYPHPSLRPVLEKTLGVPIFQEQVMRLAMVAADYTPGEADQLRRDMAAWRSSGRIERHRDKLISRMTAKGIAPDFAEGVYQQILGFGEYGFPESHAASFALIAYSTAWLKCHYPAEFTCALLNAWPMGFYTPSTIVEDARRRGTEVRPVDVLGSDWECTLEPAAGSPIAARSPTAAGSPTAARSPAPASGAGACGSAAVGGFAVRMGLRFVKGLGRKDWEAIRKVRAAAEGALGLQEFVRRTGIDEGSLAALAEAGALRGFQVDRRSALWRVSGAARWKGGRGAIRSRAAAACDGPGRAPSGGAPPGLDCAPQPELAVDDEQVLPEFAPLSAFESIGWDYLTTGHSVQGHPLEPFREELSRQGLPDAGILNAGKDGARLRYVGLVICRQRPATAGGVVFMTLEDESGFVNCVVWARVFEKYRAVILSNSVLGVEGVLQCQEGIVHLVVESCWKPRLSRSPADAESRDFH